MQVLTNVRSKFNQLPLMVQLGLVVVVAYIGYKFYKDYNKRKVAKVAAKAVNEDFENYAAKGVKKTYDASNYTSYAQRLQSAMETWGWFGTDEDSIYDVFRAMRNDVDILELEKAFGKRAYTGDWDGGILSADAPTSLATWLSRELEDEEIAKINKILKYYKIKKRY
jgi:hypothetical protein